MKFGFEGEYFVKQTVTGPFVEVPATLPRDECGYLAECRGPACEDVLDAAYMYLAEEDKLLTKANKLGYILDTALSTIRLDPKFKRELARKYGKNPYPTGRFNLYGKDFPTNDKWDRAGMHVHFSNQTERMYNPCETCKHPKDKILSSGPINIPVIVRTLDQAFKATILNEKRMLGWYETKPHGFEYRSLPAHFAGGVVAVARVIQDIKGMTW